MYGRPNTNTYPGGQLASKMAAAQQAQTGGAPPPTLRAGQAGQAGQAPYVCLLFIFADHQCLFERESC